MWRLIPLALLLLLIERTVAFVMTPRSATPTLSASASISARLRSRSVRNTLFTQQHHHHHQGASSIRMHASQVQQRPSLIDITSGSASPSSSSSSKSSNDMGKNGMMLASETVKRTIGKTLVKSAAAPENLAAFLPLCGLMLGQDSMLSSPDTSDLAVASLFLAGAQVRFFDCTQLYINTLCSHSPFQKKGKASICLRVTHTHTSHWEIID